MHFQAANSGGKKRLLSGGGFNRSKNIIVEPQPVSQLMSSNGRKVTTAGKQRLNTSDKKVYDTPCFGDSLEMQ